MSWADIMIVLGSVSAARLLHVAAGTGTDTAMQSTKRAITCTFAVTVLSSRLRKNECRRMFRSFCVFFGDLGDQLQMNHYGVGVPCGVFLKK